MEITQNVEPPTNKYNFTSIPLDGGYYIHYSNEATDNYTIKNYFRSGDILPCITLSEYNNSLPSYKLNDGSCYYRHDAIYASAYYYKVDSIPKADLLNSVGKYDEIAKLKKYPVSNLTINNYSISLGIFLGYNRTCKDKIMYKNYNKTINDTQLLLPEVKGYNIGLFALCFFLNRRKTNKSL